MAYYFDAENGEIRRKRLQQTARRTFSHINAALAPDVADPVVFHPVLRPHRAEEAARHPTEPVEVAR